MRASEAWAVNPSDRASPREASLSAGLDQSGTLRRRRAMWLSSAEAAARDVVLYGVTLFDSKDGDDFASASAKHGFEVLGQSRDKAGVSLLVAANGRADDLRDEIARAAEGGAEIAEAGSHAARFDLSLAEKVAAQ